jgi:hypothetical protein
MLQCLRSHRDLLRNGPYKGAQFSGDGDHHPMGVFAACDQLSIAFAQPHLSLPTDSLDGLGQLFEPQLEMPADFGRIPVGPGAFDQGTAGVRVAGLGDRSLAAVVSRGVFRGRQTEVAHQLAGLVEAREVSQFRNNRDRDSELDTTEGLQGVNHRSQVPALDVILEFLFEALEALGVFGDRVHVFLEDNLLGRRGTDDLTEPAQMGWASGGAACIADVVAQEKGFEAMLGRLEIVQGIFTSPTQVADGFVLDLGHIDWGEVARAHQAGQLDRVTTVRFDPIACLFGDQRWGHDPADLTFLREIAVEPIPTRTSFIDEDKLFALGLQLPDELVDVALARADGA